jgi:hypothetical protein
MAVVVIGADRLKQKLDRLASGRVARDSVAQAARYVKGQAIIYPPVRRQSQPFKTAKQRRFFFAALRDGTIAVPYARRNISGGLASRWIITSGDGGLSAAVSNDSPSGVYVMSTTQQAKYHEGNWKTEKQIADEAEGPVLDIVKRNMLAELHRQ